MIHLYKDFRQNNQIQGGILLGVQRSLHSQIYRKIKNFKHTELSSQRNGHVTCSFIQEAVSWKGLTAWCLHYL